MVATKFQLGAVITRNTVSWYYSALWLAASLQFHPSADVPIRFCDSWMIWGYAAGYTRKLSLTFTIIFNGSCHNIFSFALFFGNMTESAVIQMHKSEVNIFFSQENQIKDNVTHTCTRTHTHTNTHSHTPTIMHLT